MKIFNFYNLRKICILHGRVSVMTVFFFISTGGDPDSHFSIHPTSGKVKVAKSLDYERKSQYVLTIEARDRGSPRKSSSTTLTINLLDESDSVPTCQNTLIDVTLLETYQAGDQV